MNKKLAILTVMLGLILILPSFVSGSSLVHIRKAAPNYEAENTEIKEINDQIESRKESIEKIKNEQEKYRQAIIQKQNERDDLNNQLSLLGNRIAKTELEISKMETNIDMVNLEIKKTGLEIANREEEIINEKGNIEMILRLIHKEDSISSLEVLLLNNSFSDYINQLKYLEDIDTGVKNSLENIKAAKKDLEEKQAKLAEESRQLVLLRTDLQEKRQALTAEQDNKNYLLEQTELSEIKYQSLLSLARQEQMAAAADITNLEKKVREKMSEMDRKKLQFNDKGLIWPVTKNVVTAYFHDPDYPFRNIFEHPAIDIRAAQGSAIRATASGYVARAKNGGKGYSYIMLVHGNGLSSVYGHVSKIMVAEDDFVTQGQIIGYSGGLPGTPGAGPLTTGPHLHFEVRLNGIPVNALEYLP